MDQAVLTEYTLPAPKLKTPLRIALVSDLHERRADDIVALLRRSKPDLIAVTGDTLERTGGKDDETYRKLRYSVIKRAMVAAVSYVNMLLYALFRRKKPHKAEFAYEFLHEAAKVAPVFLSLGNHEEHLLEEDKRFFKKEGIALLDNADIVFEIKGERLRIGGLSSVYDEEWLRRFAQKDGCKLLLSHHPEYYDEMICDKAVDWVLSGHTHGGQIRLFHRAIISPGGGLFPKYGGGVYENRMVVSKGCSNTAAVPRWNNPRELVMVNLMPDSGKK